MTDLTPNIPEIVAEVREIFERYEQALVDRNRASQDRYTKPALLHTP